MMDALGIKTQLETVQGRLGSSMRSVQAAMMQLETAGPEFSDTISALRETHRLLFHLDLHIVDAVQTIEREVTL